MSEYQGLSYKTFGGADPREKSRVYYCAHEADFERFFTPITEEIFKYAHTAAIWYHEPGQENMARQQEFLFAAEHHIPILPLMQEPGLERDFNRICGDLQFLDKSALDEDPTAISYEEKLKKYLESVLVSNEMAQRIREAFDAYIFLSYRKKDRAYAQKIMRLIHENPYCRDIAIWYDEYLVPGEGFNEAIKAAFENSSLFAMAVTPHLEEKGIQTRRLFGGNLIKHPCFTNMYRNDEWYRVIGDLHNTDRIMRDTFWIGGYPGMTGVTDGWS